MWVYSKVPYVECLYGADQQRGSRQCSKTGSPDALSLDDHDALSLQAKLGLQQLSGDSVRLWQIGLGLARYGMTRIE